MYHLPTHLSLRSSDPLGFLDDQTEITNDAVHCSLPGVAQGDILSFLLDKLGNQQRKLPEIIEEIAYSLHSDGSLDTDHLQRALGTLEPSTLDSITQNLRVSAQQTACFADGSLPIFNTEQNEVTFDGKQIDFLLAHSFLGSLSQPPGNQWGRPGFTSWFRSNPHHEPAVKGYIEILLDHFAHEGYRNANHSITFKRFTAANMPDPSTCQENPSFEIVVLEEETEPSGRSEDTTFVLVSAHSQPGPGPSGTHEERLQASSPGLSISSLVSPILTRDAAVVTSLLPVHARWSGHNRTARMESLFPLTSRPSRHYILADALELDVAEDDTEGHLVDLQNDHVEREVRKLYAGFSGAVEMCRCGTGTIRPVIEAPAWGCRSFGGNLLVKAICMMIASSLANVDMVLTLVKGREDEIRAIRRIVERNLTAAELWGALQCEEAKSSCSTEGLVQVILSRSSGYGRGA